MNDCLPLPAPRVNDLAADAAVFDQAFHHQSDLANLSTSALRVLAMAAALFYRKGAVATSVRDLTRACGLTPGALYNHFASKDDLLYTVVDHGHLRVEQRLDAALGGRSDEPAPARLVAFVRAYIAGHLAQPQLAQVVRREYLHLSPERYAQIVARRRRIRARLEEILDAGQASGAFTLIGGAEGSAAQALMVLDMCSRTSEWFDPNRAPDAELVTEHYVQAAARLVGAREWRFTLPSGGL